METNAFIKDKLFDTLKPYRKLWKGHFIIANGYSGASEKAIEIVEKTGDLVAFGHAFMTNLDLPKCLCQTKNLTNLIILPFILIKLLVYSL